MPTRIILCLVFFVSICSGQSLFEDLTPSHPRLAQAVSGAQQEPSSSLDSVESASAGTDVREESSPNPAPGNQPVPDNNSTEPTRLSLNGTFVATQLQLVKVDTADWNDLKFDSIVPHGTRVQTGDTLVQFKSVSLEQAIQAAEVDQQIGRLSIEQAEGELEVLRKTTPLDLASSERKARQAAEDLNEFTNRGREQTKQTLEFAVTVAENRLAYDEEELKQLQRMYEADEVTEETEEIVLRRTRDTVESARFALQRARNSRDKGLELTIKRSAETLQKLATETSVALEKDRIELPRRMRKKEITLEKLKIDLQQGTQKLQTLKDDLTRLTLKAQIAGYVYLGNASQGNLNGIAAAITANTPGATAKQNQVIMTIVPPTPLKIKAKIAEAKRDFFKVGASALVKPTAFPHQELQASIQKISPIPVGSGEFAVELAIEQLPYFEGLMHGMTAKLTFDIAP